MEHAFPVAWGAALLVVVFMLDVLVHEWILSGDRHCGELGSNAGHDWQGHLVQAVTREIGVIHLHGIMNSVCMCLYACTYDWVRKEWCVPMRGPCPEIRKCRWGSLLGCKPQHCVLRYLTVALTGYALVCAVLSGYFYVTFQDLHCIAGVHTFTVSALPVNELGKSLASPYIQVSGLIYIA